MNMVLWALQILLALHTLMGAVWKFSNSEQLVLKALPHTVWLLLIPLELCCVVGLILPIFYQSMSPFVSLAAVGLALEMVFFTVVHLASGNSYGPMVTYWLVVCVICAGLAYTNYVK